MPRVLSSTFALYAAKAIAFWSSCLIFRDPCPWSASDKTFLSHTASFQGGEYVGERGTIWAIATVRPSVNEPPPVPGQPIEILNVPYDSKLRARQSSTLKYQVRLRRAVS